MKQPQLYTKNEKGRYEPYREPVQEHDNRLFRKVTTRSGKVSYEPCSMLMTDDLGEGVWVVTKGHSTKSITEGKYICKQFMCLKASDIQEVSLAKIGGMKRYADYLCKNFDKIPKESSLYERCCAIVGLLFQYDEEKDKK